MLFFSRNKKHYVLSALIKGKMHSDEKFSTRAEAISRMTSLLDVGELEVDYVIKRERNHFCEYVCTDGVSRFFIKRVIAQKKGE